MNDCKRAFAHWAIIVLIAFGAVYAASQAFVYVEGDDAATIAYHALGRDSQIQPPYSAYNGMMDFVLSFFPASEKTVRVAAMFISSISAVGFVLLCLRLAFDWLGGLAPREKAFVALIALLACPELLFFGLVYTPNVVAMCFILASHVVLRRVGVLERKESLTTRRSWGIVLSLGLYGLGVACRWETAAYGLVIVTDIWLGFSAQRLRWPHWRQFFFGLIWGGLALLSAFAFIAVSGYGIADLREWVEMSRQASSGYYETGFSFFTFVGRYQSFLTPFLVLLCLVGLVGFVRGRQALIAKVLVAWLPLFPLVYHGAPKLLLPVVPGLLLCLAGGLKQFCFEPLPGKLPAILRTGVVVFVLVPWLLGVRIYSHDTQWGPGFQVRIAGRDVEHGQDDNAKLRNISISRVRLAFGAGFAVATPEGPRPVGGFAAVLLGGKWRSLAVEIEEERQNLIRQAVGSDKPILQDDGNSLIIVHLLANGFHTQEPRKLFREGVNERRFIKGERQVTVLQLQERPSLFDTEQIRQLILRRDLDEVFFYSNYSSSLKKLFRVAPASAEPLGPFSAKVSLRELETALQSGATNSRVAHAEPVPQ